jgi:hypothetical protein
MGIFDYFRKKRMYEGVLERENAVKSLVRKEGKKPSSSQIADLYEQIGDRFAAIGSYSEGYEDSSKRAIAYYQLAIKLGLPIKEEERIGRKIEAYRKGKPIITREEFKSRQSREGNLEKSVAQRANAFLAIGFLAASLIFISLKVTGLTISEEADYSSLLSIVLFAIGLIFAIVYFKNKH